MQGEGMRQEGVGNVVGSMNDDTLLSDVVSVIDAYKKLFRKDKKKSKGEEEEEED
jgi:hypothetical protein